MTIDLIGLTERMFQSMWFTALVILAGISCLWYYLRHGAHAFQNPQARQKRTLFKNFVGGQPLTLVIILVVVIAVVALITQIFDIGLPM